MIWFITWVAIINATLVSNGTMLWKYRFVPTAIANGKYVVIVLTNHVPHFMLQINVTSGLSM